jgi:Fe2+ transport system protein B
VKLAMEDMLLRVSKNVHINKKMKKNQKYEIYLICKKATEQKQKNEKLTAKNDSLITHPLFRVF